MSEIGNLKAKQATGVSPQQLVNAILQPMSCLYVSNKRLTPENKEKGDKSFVEASRPSKQVMGMDGSLDSYLSCQYCKDTGHDLEKCS